MRKTVSITILLSLLFWSKLPAQNGLDSTMIKELQQMFVLDQMAAYNSKSEQFPSSLSTAEWKDSVYRAHQAVLEKMLDTQGYPGYDRVGKRGALHFFVMAQHADFNPDFQKRVLDSMYTEVLNNNADPQNYAFLVDRVNKNLGKEMVYGTQVSYHWFTGKARYLSTIDPENLNKRRAKIGLEPIEDYLDDMTEINNEQGNAIIGGISNVALLLIVALMVIAGLLFVFLKRRGKN